MSILRTSYYQNDKPYLSTKFDSNKINGLPNPHPYRELYVYSNLFEGIHLRGGKLARGGLRWSDRTEDFRTEVLGLMKAQMTKMQLLFLLVQKPLNIIFGLVMHLHPVDQLVMIIKRWVSQPEVRGLQHKGILEDEQNIYQDVSVIGIGDMAGDLFGNGMLLSRNVRLIGAFNHMHIFIDPNPDVKNSFTERKRLFKLPFSTWMDYNKGLISQGGGVFERSSKQINVSQEMKKCFGITENVLSPNSLIRYLLKAEVDLIWNGGIGTFVKAKSESHNVVGDKTNDELRVNGRDIRASMFIEGGNLGCTQLGRIEYAKSGGYINADFIDNSAGVICSDLEVNIKIAFVSIMKEGGISLKKRNEILASMVDEVASKVLEDHNRIETKALLLECLQAKERLEQHHRLLLNLEKSGLLERSIEFLPADEEIAKMLTEAEGFSSPQLAILMSYTRTAIKSEIIHSDLPEKDSFCHDYLLNKLSFINLDDVTKFKNAIETLSQNLTHVLDEHLLENYRYGSVSLIELNIDKI
ncbi:unnamed protein product [Ceratitis capitata]|uniref:(Mediterranean fruit fly) hypothetical protein n=1 Tax=Ceratitis capitata TaxID=7213 RepID=A0A811UYQ9_CERCA|nr:unnamed protein product [Ceratitis capitata]